MKELLAYTSSYMFVVCHILFVCFFLLALNFIFGKTKIFKLMFILFVIKQLLSNVT